MLTKKQLRRLLIGGGALFIAAFAVFFSYFYFKGIKDPITPQDQLAKETASETISPVVQIREEEPVVLPTTKVVLKVVDTRGQLITEKEIPGTTLLGATKEKLVAQFEGYEVVQFDAYEVILQKQQAIKEIPLTYSLVIQEGMLGILEKGNTVSFISLEISENEFSVANKALFEGEGLPITLNEKIQLQQQPYYVEQILQNYNE